MRKLKFKGLSLNPFKIANKFVKNKKEAKSLLKINEKKEELKMLGEVISKIIRPTPLVVNDSVADYDTEPKGANVPVYFYDFLKEWNNGTGFSVGGGNFVQGGMSNGAIAMGAEMDMSVPSNPNDPQPIGITIGISENIEESKPKAVIKPIDVFHELEKLPNAVSLENLEEKIVTFKMREKFIRYNQYAKKEVIDMVVRLENRRQWEKYKDFFEQFDYTTTEKINALLSKYDLVLKSSDLFIPTFPKEAIEIMDKYESKVVELCNKKPVFYVIAENEKFKKEFGRNDPILLAQSPFGIFWDILGVWDEEILLLEEL